jgi:hypothetical protein
MLPSRTFSERAMGLAMQGPATVNGLPGVITMAGVVGRWQRS